MGITRLKEHSARSIITREIVECSKLSIFKIRFEISMGNPQAAQEERPVIVYAQSEVKRGQDKCVGEVAEKIGGISTDSDKQVAASATAGGFSSDEELLYRQKTEQQEEAERVEETPDQPATIKPAESQPSPPFLIDRLISVFKWETPQISIAVLSLVNLYYLISFVVENPLEWLILIGIFTAYPVGFATRYVLGVADIPFHLRPGASSLVIFDELSNDYTRLMKFAAWENPEISLKVAAGCFSIAKLINSIGLIWALNISMVFPLLWSKGAIRSATHVALVKVRQGLSCFRERLYELVISDFRISDITRWDKPKRSVATLAALNASIFGLQFVSFSGVLSTASNLLGLTLLGCFALKSAGEPCCQTPAVFSHEFAVKAKLNLRWLADKAVALWDFTIDILLWKDSQITLQDFGVSILIAFAVLGFGMLPTMILVVNAVALFSHPAVVEQMGKLKRA